VGGLNDEGKAENNFTDDQFASLAELLTKLLVKHPKAEILGHRDLPKVAKDCPCFSVKQWWHDTVVDPKVD
jgi:N-acetylmuramoyl-L-alanine amidase